jgi:hypothetical protein
MSANTMEDPQTGGLRCCEMLGTTQGRVLEWLKLQLLHDG